MTELVEVERLSVTYAQAVALRSVSIQLGAGEAMAVLGANGAGKTSLLKAITGLVPARAATLRLGGVSLTKLAAHTRAGLGIGYVPEGRRLFPGMTVRENLVAAVRRPARARARATDRVYDIFPQLAERDAEPTWQLSGGQQQMVAIGRALMLEPKLLLMDEPTLGLAPIVIAELLAALQTIRRETGVALLLVEQHVDFASQLCAHGLVLRRGTIARRGPMAELTATQGQVV